MKYTVLWSHRAEEDLATLWVHAAERSSIAEAANEIDQRLRNNAPGEGESRSLGVRILLIPPLGVTFTVSAEDQLVRIVHVWQFQYRRES